MEDSTLIKKIIALVALVVLCVCIATSCDNTKKVGAVANVSDLDMDTVYEVVGILPHSLRLVEPVTSDHHQVIVSGITLDYGRFIVVDGKVFEYPYRTFRGGWLPEPLPPPHPRYKTKGYVGGFYKP